MPKPLEGIKVVDFTHVMAGPFASHFLSLLGAEVIKIEPPGGDHFRYYGHDRRFDGMSPAFIAANLGKKSLALDLKTEGAKKIVRQLIETADVVMENFRPGVIDRLGFGVEACRALNADIIFCSISGYGQTGPWRDFPALDQILQATSGMMMVNGRAEDPPLRVGYPVVDTYTGTVGALSVLAALLKRERFGKGTRIDVAMLDTTMVLLTSAVTPYLVAGQVFPRTGNRGYSREPTADCFETSDGTIVSLAVTRQPMFEAMCREIGREEWIADPRFADRRARNLPENAATLTGLLAEVFKTRPGLEWETRLNAIGAPCGMVREIPAGCSLDQLAAREVVQDCRIEGLPDPDVRVLNAGFSFDADGPETGAPPSVGEHADEILQGLGYSAAEIGALRTDGVVHSGADTA